ncbi:hypothetical protein [Winogradskyella ouciana]|uniref:hypothetical protein n=1 Tax=Winogradskyella ouciana TaxID=2608631 RepID=UPI003D2BBB8D
METVTIGYIVIGILVVALLLQRKRIDKNAEYDSYADEKNEWSILTSFAEFKIMSKYAGEFPHGPSFIHIKTEPKNILDKHFFGDWFYRTENGVYLQKWNSNPLKGKNLTNSNSDLIFINQKNQSQNTVKSEIKALWFDMEKNDKNELILILNNVTSSEKVKITNANNV